MEPVQGPANDQAMHNADRLHGFPRLLADVGGTNIRFAIENSPGILDVTTAFPRESFASIFEALHRFMNKPMAIAAGANRVRHVALAMANPVEGDWVRMTNAAWEFSIDAIRREFAFDTLLVVNDFSALAMAIPLLSVDEKRQVGGGDPEIGKAIGLLGAGTGLGVSGLIPADHGWIALEGEGGHVSFSPVSEKEIEILRFAWKTFAHASAERFMSGMGLELIYRALLDISGAGGTPKPASAISHGALAEGCTLCDEAVELFCTMLGTVAGNLALTLGAKGGVYLGGGIVPKLGERFDRSGFRQRFETKGRFSDYLSRIPTYVITAENPTLRGVSTMLSAALK